MRDALKRSSDDEELRQLFLATLRSKPQRHHMQSGWGDDNRRKMYQIGGNRMGLSHINEKGYARMVDVSDKQDTVRVARAQAIVCMQPETLAMIREGTIKKGDVLSVAQVAGIMGAKHTAQIIPMCHPIFLSGVDLDFCMDEVWCSIIITSQAKTTGKTGVEMEALTAVTWPALTIYDMCKHWIAGELNDIRMLEKSGGKCGHLSNSKLNKSWVRWARALIQGRLYSICISSERGQLKNEVDEAQLVQGYGIENDSHAGDWGRQVTCLAKESVEKVNQEKNLQIGPGQFAENLLIEGLDFPSVGVAESQIGAEAILEVSQIGKRDHPSIVTETFGVSLLPYEVCFAG